MEIRDIRDLRFAYGTYAKAADVLGMSPQALHNCLKRGSLPKASYFVQRIVLKRDGHTAAPDLWGFAKPEDTK